MKKSDSCCRKGTIIIKTNGNAKESFEDFITHRMINAMTCMTVKRCIFHVGTLRTYASGGWYFAGMKNSPRLLKIFFTKIIPNLSNVDKNQVNHKLNTVRKIEHQSLMQYPCIGKHQIAQTLESSAIMALLLPINLLESIHIIRIHVAL